MSGPAGGPRKALDERPCLGRVATAERDRHGRLEQPRVFGQLFERPGDHAACGGGPTLGKPEQGEAGLGSTAERAALRIGAFGLVEAASDPMLLGHLVMGVGDSRIDRRSGKHEPGPLHLVSGSRPVTVEAHELGAVNEAPAAEHEVGLRGTPVRERGRPFLCPPDVEDRIAILDGRAVHHPGHRRRHLAGGYADHRLVEEADPAVELAHRDQRLAAAQPPERRQVGVTEALGDR